MLFDRSNREVIKTASFLHSDTVRGPASEMVLPTFRVGPPISLTEYSHPCWAKTFQCGSFGDPPAPLHPANLTHAQQVSTVNLTVELLLALSLGFYNEGAVTV